MICWTTAIGLGLLAGLLVCVIGELWRLLCAEVRDNERLTAELAKAIRRKLR